MISPGEGDSDDKIDGSTVLPSNSPLSGKALMYEQYLESKQNQKKEKKEKKEKKKQRKNDKKKEKSEKLPTAKNRTGKLASSRVNS